MSVLYKYEKGFYSCSICLSDEFSTKDELPIQLKCDHIFHESCINSLINSTQKTPKCPNCRQQVVKKRICYEILKGYRQIFMKMSIKKKPIVLWISEDSTFEELAHQIFVQHQIFLYDQFYLTTPLGKSIIITDQIRKHFLNDYNITHQQQYQLNLLQKEEKQEQQKSNNTNESIQ